MNNKTRRAWQWMCIGWLASGCVGASPGPAIVQDDAAVAEASEPSLVFQAPTFGRLAPSEIQLGDKVQVFGSNFLAEEYGRAWLVLEGTYVDEFSNKQNYQGEFPLTVLNTSLAEFEFDQLYFTSFGNIGTFQGTAHVVTRLDVNAQNASAGEELQSSSGNAVLGISPSIDVTEFSTADGSDCAPVTDATVGGTNLDFGIRVLGIGEATPEDPITVRIAFDSATTKVQYVKEDLYQTWPLDLYPGNQDTVYTDAPDGQNTLVLQITSGNTLRIDPLRNQHRVQVEPGVLIGQQYTSSVLLGRLAAAVVEGGPGPNSLNLFVVARRADGRTAQRAVTIDVWNEWEVRPYDQNQVLVERYPAEIPSGPCGSCTSGGDIGRELSYSEGESVSHSRALSMRWDVNVATSVGAQVMYGPFVPWQIAVNAQTTWASTFGIDVNESVSTEQHRSLNLSAMILPTFYGVCYRQLSRYERTVDVMYHNACGESGVVGEVAMTDWGWGFDVATGQVCVPSTNLPPPMHSEE